MMLYELSSGEREQLIRYAAARHVPFKVAAQEYLNAVNESWFQDQLTQFLRRISADRR